MNLHLQARTCSCTFKLYLEGRNTLDTPAAERVAPEAASSTELLHGEPQAKRRRTAQECVQELLHLKELVDSNLLTMEECADLKAKLLSGD